MIVSVMIREMNIGGEEPEQCWKECGKFEGRGCIVLRCVKILLPPAPEFINAAIITPIWVLINCLCVGRRFLPRYVAGAHVVAVRLRRFVLVRQVIGFCRERSRLDLVCHEILSFNKHINIRLASEYILWLKWFLAVAMFV